MRHRKQGRKFGRKKGQRQALLTSLAHNLIIKEKITTTLEKAKELKKNAERFVSYGKKQNLAGLRLLLKNLPKVSAYKVYNQLARQYEGRNGGYLRIIKTQNQRRDSAQMARIEFV